ncbi:MAG: AI-2E family transporter [Clostridiales bacterium]|nr:AI-2E family transporter [Clostridiales bacterium]
MKKLDHYLGNIGKVLSATFKGLGSVIRTQLLLSLLTFIILCIGLAILDISYWGLIAFAIALVDLIPLVGSGIIMIPWAVVLLIMGKSELAFPLLILYIVIFIGRQVLEPVMNGKSIGIKPLYTFLATILASIVFGAWGLVLGPVIAIIIKTVLDLKEGQNH